MGGMDSQDAISVVALVISVVALVGAILQLLQQYASSAEGYANCGEAVMGEWYKTRRRKFRWSELRFEVQFDAPVIFVCPPGNHKGPLGEKSDKIPLWHIQGTIDSEIETRTPSVESENKKSADKGDRHKLHKAVHTADNERANWFILLQALHEMEGKSQAWQAMQLSQDRKLLGPKQGAALPAEVAPWSAHSVVAALQPKRKSWDTMPSEVRKPYATTTICHMVEIAAMLGLHWREFDRSNHKYRAEGNGYLLTGDNVDDLGILFRFQVYAKNKFEQRRIIPSNAVKMLAFGNVPTIHGPEKGKAVEDLEDLKSSGVLQFGNASELAESLTYYGCNSKTTSYFRDEKKWKQAHLFPVVFEVLGMVATSVYIPSTYFRFLPNPTTYTWNRKNFSLRKLLLEFRKAIQSPAIAGTHHILELQSWSDDLHVHLKDWANEDDFSLALLTCLHATIQKCDAYLAPKEDAAMNERMAQMVKLVVREHVQEVMRLLNDAYAFENNDDEDSDDSTLSSRERGTTGAAAPANKKTNNNNNNNAESNRSTTFFDVLNTAAPEERQRELVNEYFNTVRVAVMQNTPATLKKRDTAPYVPSVASRSDFFDLASPSSGQGIVESPPVTPGYFAAASEEKSEDVQEKILEHPSLRRMPTGANAELAQEIWCTLVFRSFCWLLLHDFHKKDVQISKSELYASRLPVYIA